MIKGQIPWLQMPLALRREWPKDKEHQYLEARIKVAQQPSTHIGPFPSEMSDSMYKKKQKNQNR